MHLIENGAYLAALDRAGGLKHSAGHVQYVFRECPLVFSAP
jgi:hypothetical protein